VAGPRAALAGLGRREGQQLLHQPGAVLQRGLGGVQGLLAAAVVGLAPRIDQLGVEHRQRGAQLVGGIGNEAAVGRHVVVQPGRVVVHGVGQRRQLGGQVAEGRAPACRAGAQHLVAQDGHRAQAAAQAQPQQQATPVSRPNWRHSALRQISPARASRPTRVWATSISSVVRRAR
jgi:hypothetical protein